MSQVSKPGDVAQYRCVLCWYERRCKRETCRYAHSLDELLPPDERVVELPRVWKDGVYRWYGQAVDASVVWHIRSLYLQTPKCQRPVWATGCLWFYKCLPKYVRIDELPYDFGVYQDLEVVRMFRLSQEYPFKMAHGFHRRIGDRLRHLSAARIPMSPQFSRRSIETTSTVLDAPEPAAGRIVLRENQTRTPPSPSSSSSDSRLVPKCVRKDELCDVDSEQTELGSDMSFSTMRQRVSAMSHSVPPRRQVSDDGSTHTSDETKADEAPEVSHPKGDASPDVQSACIDSSCLALICEGNASAVGSAVFGTDGAPPRLGSSTSSTSGTSSTSSSNTSRSRSIRGKGS